MRQKSTNVFLRINFNTLLYIHRTTPDNVLVEIVEMQLTLDILNTEYLNFFGISSKSLGPLATN